MNEASILGKSVLTPIAIAESCQLSTISFFVFQTSSAVSQPLAVLHLTENGYKPGYTTKPLCKHALVAVLCFISFDKIAVEQICLYSESIR
jgi:hypothetical protein